MHMLGTALIIAPGKQVLLYDDYGRHEFRAPTSYAGARIFTAFAKYVIYARHLPSAGRFFVAVAEPVFPGLTRY